MARLAKSAVCSFYTANWRTLNPNVGKNLSTPEPKKRTPKMQDIIDLDEAMTSHRDRAILSTSFCVIIMSPLGIVEASSPVLNWILSM